MTQIRCPVCNGCGAVEEWFGTGKLPYDEIGWTWEKQSKQCPACLGTGIQIIFDISLPTPPENEWFGRYPILLTMGGGEG
jgi:hypothetical protein